MADRIPNGTVVLVRGRYGDRYRVAVVSACGPKTVTVRHDWTQRVPRDHIQHILSLEQGEALRLELKQLRRELGLAQTAAADAYELAAKAAIQRAIRAEQEKTK